MFKKIKNLLLMTILSVLVVNHSYADENKKINEQGKQKLFNLIEGEGKYLNLGADWRSYNLVVDGGEIFNLNDDGEVYFFNKNLCKDNQVELFFSANSQFIRTIDCKNYIKEDERNNWLKVSLNKEENKKIKEFIVLDF